MPDDLQVTYLKGIVHLKRNFISKLLGHFAKYSLYKLDLEPNEGKDIKTEFSLWGELSL